mgnify:CR=1 FL=1
MTHVRRFQVLPALPERLKPLRDLAFNLWWTWEPDAAELFRLMDLELWEQVGHNPVLLLARIRQERLNKLSRDPAYLAYMERSLNRYRAYMEAETWFSREHGNRDLGFFAYFSAEFGLHECLPVYAGGLGVLAWPKKVEVVRRIGRNSAGLMQEETVLVDLQKIARGQQPDFFIKPNDLINVGTHGTSVFLFRLRNAFRATYGFGFIYDRNFADRHFGDTFSDTFGF